jgi:uncharacterized cupredoxin-like copper-binding protein
LGLGVVLVGFVLAACGQSSGAPAPVSSGEITIKATEWKFEPANISVEAGKPIKLVLRNEGKIEHNVHVTGLTVGGNELQLQAKTGETVSLEFTPDKSGTFDLACTLPAHKDAGMVGKFEVVKAAGR